MAYVASQDVASEPRGVRTWCQGAQGLPARVSLECVFSRWAICALPHATPRRQKGTASESPVSNRLSRCEGLHHVVPLDVIHVIQGWNCLQASIKSVARALSTGFVLLLGGASVGFFFLLGGIAEMSLREEATTVQLIAEIAAAFPLLGSLGLTAPQTLKIPPCGRSCSQGFRAE